MSIPAFAALAALSGLLATPASAQQTLLPVYGLPVPDPALPAGAGRLALQGGYGLLRGNGAAMDGFFGGWAVEMGASGRWAFGAGAGGHGLSGKTEVAGSGKVGTTAVGVDPGGFVSRRMDLGAGRAALHAGLSFPFSVQNYAVATFALTPSGRVSLTPDTSYSLSVALPVGAGFSHPVGSRWSASCDVSLLQVVAGKRWDVLAALGPFSPKHVHRVSPHPVGRLAAALKHSDTGLSLLWDYAARPRVDGHAGLWSTALRLGWDYALKGGT
jgi:hypothetical protein